MTVFEIAKQCWLPRPLEEVFPFFSAAANLGKITPRWIQFRILTPLPIRMCAGAIIDYRIRVHGLPLRWRTEITEWDPPRRFVDTQLRGPYRQWIHEHRFERRDGGTLCLDHVRYAVYGGTLINRLFVARDVNRIFAHRESALLALFPPAPALPASP